MAPCIRLEFYGGPLDGQTATVPIALVGETITVQKKDYFVAQRPRANGFYRAVYEELRR